MARFLPSTAMWCAALLVSWFNVAPCDAAGRGDVAVARVWSRATAPGTSVGVAYFEVTNGSDGADELVAIDSPACARVQMHATTMNDGMMQMRQTDSVTIPAGGRVVFEPSGLHAMLLELKAPLKAGQRVPLTLVFRRAGKVSVEALVQGIGAQGPPPAAAAAPPDAYRLSVWPQRAQSPTFELIDTAGKVRRLRDFRGQVVVLFFGFVHCPDVCPAELFKLSLVMKKLGALSSRVQVLFVTLDPRRDSRAVLKSYVAAFDPRFVGLTGTASQIDAAAANFFVEYARVGSGKDYTIDHSTSTFVLDASGRLRLVGAVNAGVDDYAHDLAALAAL